MCGRRSSFQRRARDLYQTPVEGVLPLLPHLPDGFTFAEPCVCNRRLGKASGETGTGVTGSW